MLATASSNYIAMSKRYLNIELLRDQQMRGAITAGVNIGRRSAQIKVRKILDTT
jgi:hypothetical protein